MCARAVPCSSSARRCSARYGRSGRTTLRRSVGDAQHPEFDQRQHKQSEADDEMSGGRLNEKCYAAGDRKSREGDSCSRREAAETAASTNGGEAAEHGHVPRRAPSRCANRTHIQIALAAKQTLATMKILRRSARIRASDKSTGSVRNSRAKRKATMATTAATGAKIETRSSAASRLQVLLLRVKA